MADGQLLSLPLFFNADQIKPGTLAKTSPYMDKNEILLVEIFQVYNWTNLSALIHFQYIDNKTGEKRPEVWQIEAQAREIKSDRRMSAKASRRLWTAVPGSLKKIYTRN